MKYVSSFIHVPGTDNIVAIDVIKIDNISGRNNNIFVYTGGGSSPMIVKMDKQKFIDLVEDKRRELWMNERAAQIESSKLMMDLIETVGSLKASEPEPDPLKTIEDARATHCGHPPYPTA